MKQVLRMILFLVILANLGNRWGFVEGLNNQNNNNNNNNANANGKSCRCLPGAPCWPSLLEWQQLNASVDGRLRTPVPPAAPCHQRTYDPALCAEVTTRWFDPYWRVEQLGAAQYPIWEALGSQTCLPFDAQKNTTCFQGSVPVYAVDALTTVHIQTSVSFASLHNLRLVVKTSGHDFLGRSSAPDSFLIWTRHFNNHTFHQQFAPQGCPKDCNEQLPTSALTVQGGARWVDVHDGLVSKNLLVMSSFIQDLSAAGGYVQGGGHSHLAPTFGLCTDNVIEFEVVTADGSLKVANQCQNKELFWALRGGGGATFGVVVSATHRTYPDFQRYIYAQIVITTDDKKSMQNITLEFLLLHPDLSDIGWRGYFLVANNSLTIDYLLVNSIDVDMAQQDFSKLFTFVNSNKLINITHKFTIFTNYDTWRQTLSCKYSPITCEASVLIGYNLLVGSRLIPRLTLENPHDTTRLTKALFEIISTQGLLSGLVCMFVAGGDVSKPRDNAVNPAWRSALVHIAFYSLYDFGANQSDIEFHTNAIDYATRLLTNVTPGSGAYINEASYNEPEWQQSLFGSNYPRLKHIKDQIDPKGLFVCHHCVGSEEWNEDLSCPIHA